MHVNNEVHMKSLDHLRSPLIFMAEDQGYQFPCREKWFPKDNLKYMLFEFYMKSFHTLRITSAWNHSMPGHLGGIDLAKSIWICYFPCWQNMLEYSASWILIGIKVILKIKIQVMLLLNCKSLYLAVNFQALWYT